MLIFMRRIMFLKTCLMSKNKMCFLSLVDQQEQKKKIPHTSSAIFRTATDAFPKHSLKINFRFTLTFMIDDKKKALANSYI